MDYFTRFNEAGQTVSINPLVDWTQQTAGFSSPAINGARSEVPVERRYCRALTSITGHHFLSWDKVASDAYRADFDAIETVILPLVTVQRVHVIGRSPGAYNGYVASMVIATNELILYSVVAGVATAISTVTVIWDVTASYFLQLRCNGSAIKARAWKVTAPDPSTWNISVQSTTITAAGLIGFGGYHATLTGKLFPINTFSIATNQPNLLSYAEAFDNAAWTKTNAVVSADNTIGPDGAGGADNLIDTAVNAGHYVYQAVSNTAGSPMCASVHAKPFSLRYITIQLSDSISDDLYATFDTQTGTVTQAVVASNVVNPWTNITAGVIPGSDDWNRFWVKGNVPVGRTATYMLIHLSNTPTYAAYLGTGSSLYIWGARMDASEFPLKYAPEAVRPITNVEYTAWLGGKVKPGEAGLRCVTAELSASGYDAATSPYIKEVKAFVSNIGYDTKAQDTPANQHFENIISEIPTFSRQMGVALSGQASVGFGKLKISNPVEDGPPRAPALEFKQTMLGGGNCYVYRRISAPAYVIPAGSRLEYDFYIDPANPAISAGAGGIEVDLTAAPTNGRNANWADTLGDLCSNLNSSGAHYVAGVWYSRTLPFVASMIGTTIATVDLVNEADIAGAYRSLYRNIRITNASGVTLSRIWESGQPSVNTVGYSALNSAESIGVVEASLSPTSTEATTTLRTKGVRDDWLRMRWNRNYLTVKLGDPTWAHHQFRTIIYGRLGQPSAGTKSEIEFPIADLADIFNAPITTERFSSVTGPDVLDQYVPLFFGRSNAASNTYIEPPLTKKSALEFTLHAGNLNSAAAVVYDENTKLSTSDRTILSVAGNVITTNTNHGMVENYRVYFPSTGTAPPTPLAYNTNYYVRPSPGLNTFELGLFAGSASSIALTNTTAGANVLAYGWYTSGTPHRLTLAAPNVGRILVGGLKAFTTAYTVAQIYSLIMTSYIGVSNNFKDNEAFAQLEIDVPTDVLLFTDSGIQIANTVCAKLAAGTLTWYGISRDGFMQVGALKLPGTPRMTLTTADIREGTLRRTNVIRAIDFSKSAVSGSPSYLRSPAPPTWSFLSRIGKTVMPAVSYGAAGIPLENHPDRLDSNVAATFDFLFDGITTVPANIVELYKKPLGVWDMEAPMTAMDLDIGDTVKIVHPEEGWKTWTSLDPASPDNTGAIDNTLAVVIGSDVNLNTDMLRLTVYRPLTSIFPTANLN